MTGSHTWVRKGALSAGRTVAASSPSRNRMRTSRSASSGTPSRSVPTTSPVSACGARSRTVACASTAAPPSGASHTVPIADTSGTSLPVSMSRAAATTRCRHCSTAIDASPSVLRTPKVRPPPVSIRSGIGNRGPYSTRWRRSDV
ncbi:Uncharacterised protein [Mycobacteroides abscessus subsp. abscessus]|nr:Uncharacterised protein [Mycobacteroides abscessus subsp. abscessus]